MTYLILTLISCLIVAVYLICYISHCGLPASISATYYNTQHKWLLPVVLGVSVATALVPFFDLTPDYWRFLVFLTIAGLMFVAAAPAFRQEFESKVHAVAAIVSGVSAIAWIIVISGIPWLVLAGVLTAIVNWKYKTFLLEVGILSNLYIALICLTV